MDKLIASLILNAGLDCPAPPLVGLGTAPVENLKLGTLGKGEMLVVSRDMREYVTCQGSLELFRPHPMTLHEPLEYTV